ncbi:hypothetical protein KY385_00420 [Candidatus Parcubacteria bacterium]|nr:hypothetical protein [Candidatus Parcubacteria bacterium]
MAFTAFGELEPVRLKDQEIPSHMLYPHFTDERFTRSVGGRTIFLAQGLVLPRRGIQDLPGTHYNYSDRIYHGFDPDLVKRAMGEAEEKTAGNRNTAAYFELMLQGVYEDSAVELQHIIAGINNDNGESYQVFGTISGAEARS